MTTIFSIIAITALAVVIFYIAIGWLFAKHADFGHYGRDKGNFILTVNFYNAEKGHKLDTVKLSAKSKKQKAIPDITLYAAGATTKAQAIKRGKAEIKILGGKYLG